MITCRTPHRISFFGGGTDYPQFFEQYGGKTLGVAIDKYCYISIRELPPFFDFNYRVVYSRQENVKTIEEIQHPAVRTVLQHMQVDSGLSIHHDSDIPARSGMGSSSAFTVGMLNALYALHGRIRSKKDLALEAIHVEQNLIKENVGSQDQTFAAYGGLNVIEFMKNGEVVVSPIILSHKRLEAFRGRLMLFFSGLSRTASEIVQEQIGNTEKNLKELFVMKDMVDKAYGILTSQCDLCEFGALLNETWRLKKALSKRITTPQIDTMYDKAMEAGALGGKLLGAGGGGFMLVFAEPENQPAIRKAMEDYLQIPFGFDFDGSRIIVYEPYYSTK
ncbi:MAG: kinase [Planctomycetes bacterium]|nr:kinase [Planctomycetota bacterium]